MNEQEMMNRIGNLEAGIEMLKAQNDAQQQVIESTSERFNVLEKIFFDEIVNPAREAIEGQKRLDSIEDFRGRHGEKLEPFNDTLKAIEGDDFDLVATAYDEMSALEPMPESGSPEEMAYVDETVNAVTEQIEKIKTQFGLVGDVTMEVTEEGETTITDEEGNTVVETAEGEMVEETEIVDSDMEQGMEIPTTDKEIAEIEDYEKSLEDYL